MLGTQAANAQGRNERPDAAWPRPGPPPASGPWPPAQASSGILSSHSSRPLRASGDQDGQEVGGQVVPPRPATAPWGSSPVQCQEHGPAAVAPAQRGVGVVAVLLDALPEPAVAAVDPLAGGRGCQAAAGPTPPASTRRPPPLPRTHRPVEVAPAAHGHKEASVHSLQGHDPHSDGADLNDACGEGLGQGPGRHLRPRAPACMPSLTHSRSISCVPGLVLGVGTHRGPHGPCQELPRGLEDISWGVLAFSGGHWGATARCGVGEGPGQVRGNKTAPEQAGAYPGELLISVRASKEEQ